MNRLVEIANMGVGDKAKSTYELLRDTENVVVFLMVRLPKHSGMTFEKVYLRVSKYRHTASITNLTKGGTPIPFHLDSCKELLNEALVVSEEEAMAKIKLKELVSP